MDQRIRMVRGIFLALIFLTTHYSAPILACSSFDDPELLKQKQACEEDISREWSCELNRCMTTEDSKKAREDYEACSQLPNYDERKKCHDDYAVKYTGIKNTKEPPYMIGAGVSAALATMMVLNMAAAKNAKGKCISKYVLAAAGGAGVMSEIYFQMSAKKQLEKLQEDYKKEQEQSSAYHQQVRALQYLKMEQEMVQDYSKNRKTAYMMLTAGYGMAMAMAIFDMRKPSCGGKGDSADSSGGDGTTAQGPASGEVGGSSVSSAGVSQAMGHPVGIIMMAGVGLGVSAYLWKAASDQEKLAKENVAKIDAMIEKFNALMAGHCPSGRDSYEAMQVSPRCYCYTESGSRNNDRSNSETCKALWEEDSKNYFIPGRDYDISKSDKPKMGCMAVNGKYDENCACRDLKNAQGDNACIKVPVQVALEEPGLSLQAKDFAKTLNSVNAGELTAADLNHSDLEKMATKVNKLNSMILPEAIKEAKANFATDLKVGDRFSDQFIRSMKKSDQDLALASAAPFGLASMSDRKIDDALDLKALELAGEQINSNDKKVATIEGGKNNAAVKATPAQSFSMDMGESKVENFGQSDESTDQAGELVKYDDISDSGASLWEILTKRYHQSGIRRLFKDDNREEIRE